VFKAWIVTVVLALLLFVHAVVVGAVPPMVRLLGLTPTPTLAPDTPTPIPMTRVPSSPCDPVVRKQVSPNVAAPGDEVAFTITVANRGRETAVHARVLDSVQAYLEVLKVTVIPGDQGREVVLRSSQSVVVDVGTLGQDFEVTVRIRTRVRQDAPAQVCVENLAEFRAPNCPDRNAEVICWQLPETGGERMAWLLFGGLATSVLVSVLVWSLARPSRGAEIA
jgi:uncharacterized repeat protein (TIGR01451 family)/LPXTG-motif cell wall-anchored protein